MKSLIILCITVLLINTKPITEWEIAKSDNGTQISYRWVIAKNEKKYEK